MTTNVARHRRRSIRLPGYDYTSPVAYFVTICVQDGECRLGDVVSGEIVLNLYGRVAATYWARIPRHFPHVELDAWVVMPNHVHGIIVISGRGEAAPAVVWTANPLARTEGFVRPISSGAASPLRDAPIGPSPGSLGAIVGNYKSIVTKRINRLCATPGVRFWQRNYYEHIIRNDDSLQRIRKYIAANPARWEEGQLHPDAPPNPFQQRKA